MGDVIWQTSEAADVTAIERLWQDVATRGWLDATCAHVVIHVAGWTPDDVAVRTARVLMDILRRDRPSCTISVVDDHAAAAEWPGARLLDVSRRPVHRVDSACLRGGAPIPELWLEDFRLITVAAVAPHPKLRLAAILAAQARLVSAPDAREVERMYVAHRLMASDVGVACGTLSFGDDKSPRWWASSADDIALETHVAAAAGATPVELPHCRYLARHEVLSLASVSVRGRSPVLRGYLASPAGAFARQGLADLGFLGRRTMDDCRRAAANLHRLPQFVRRRLPAALRPRSA